MAAAAMVLVQCWAAAGAETSEGLAKGRENQPPVLNVNIPLQSFLEDNLDNKGYHLINLSKYFSDDGGAENLTFSVVCVTEPTNMSATVDGCFLSFTVTVEDWIGQEKFRVRATDAGGLWAESNDFTVRVVTGPSHVRILPLPEVIVWEEEERFFDLTPYVTNELDDELTVRTNSSSVKAVGPLLLIKFHYAEESGDVCVTANDTVGHSHANLAVTVLENPGWGPRDFNEFNITLPEDGIYQQTLSNIGPLNPEVVWRIDSFYAGVPPAYNVSFINNDTLRVEGCLHRYGTGLITATVSVLYGLSWQYSFNVSVQFGGISDRLVQISQVNATEHQNVSFRLIKEDPWDDLAFEANATAFNITPDGWVNFTPDQNEVGEWPILVRVRLKAHQTDYATMKFTLTVINVNEPPENATIQFPLDNTKYLAGRPIPCRANATDPDGDTLFYSWYEEPGTLHGHGKQFNLTKLTVGRRNIFVEVSDGEYRIRSRAVTVTIAPKPETITDESPVITYYAVIVVIIGALLATLAAVWASREKKR